MIIYWFFKKLESLSSKDACAKIDWLKLAQWFWRRRFLNFVYVFSLLRIISPWKKAGPFIWTNLNPLHPRMLCAKFGSNWPSGSGDEDENVESLQTTDDRWSEKLTWAFSSVELIREEGGKHKYIRTYIKI